MSRNTKNPALAGRMRLLAPILLLPLALLACGEEPAPTAVALDPSSATAATAPAAHASQEELLRAVRRATAQFHSATQAARAGYLETDHCVPGMGYHWLNPSIIDPIFDPMQPEVMIYAPGPDGQTRLVAVEYIVIDAGQPRPSFAGHPMDIGGTPVPAPHWSLHVWMYGENPDGIFTAVNPSISCE